MVIMFFGGGYILLLLAGVMLVGSVIFAIWYAITEAKAESENTPKKEFTTGQRIALLFDILAIFACVASLAYGWVENNGVAAVIGILGWMVASTIAAYACSPLRLPNFNTEGRGCAAIFMMPLLGIVSLVSMLLIMFISWIFALAAVLKGLSKKVYIVIGVSILLLAGVAVAIGLSRQAL